MTLLGMESFDWHPGGDNASAAFINRKWVPGARPFPLRRDVGRFGFGYSMVSGNGNSGNGGYQAWYKPVPTNPSEIIVGYAFKMAEWPIVGEGPGIAFKGQGSGDGNILSVVFGGLNTAVVNVSGAGRVLTSPIGIFEFNAWNFVEVRLKLNGIHNEFQLRLNQKTIWNMSNWNPWGSGAGSGFTNMDAFIMISAAVYSAPVMWLDDIYYSDTLGVSPWNTFLGNARSVGSLTSSDGDHQDSTIGGTLPAASRWQSVHDVLADEVNYVYNANAAGVGKYDLYRFNPGVDSATIFGVQTSIVARQDDATQMAIQAILKSGSTQVNGPTENLSQAYSGAQVTSQIDPSTSLAWLADAANTAQLGYEIVTPSG